MSFLLGTGKLSSSESLLTMVCSISFTLFLQRFRRLPVSTDATGRTCDSLDTAPTSVSASSQAANASLVSSRACLSLLVRAW